MSSTTKPCPREERGEWTAESVKQLVWEKTGADLLNDVAQAVADAHNAALKATEQIGRDVWQHTVEELQKQLETAQINAELWHEEMMKADKRLKAEREKTSRWQVREMAANRQLLAAQAAIEESTCCAIDVDLSALREHDAERVKPLVAALEDLLNMSGDPNAKTGEFDTTAGRARRLLASVKEG